MVLSLGDFGVLKSGSLRTPTFSESGSGQIIFIQEKNSAWDLWGDRIDFGVGEFIPLYG